MERKSFVWLIVVSLLVGCIGQKPTTETSTPHPTESPLQIQLNDSLYGLYTTAKGVLTKYAFSDGQLTQEDIDKVKGITGYNKTDPNFFDGFIEANSQDPDGITDAEYGNLEALSGIYKTAPQLAQKLMIDDTDLGQNKTFQEAWKSWGFDPAASYYLSEAYGPEITPEVKKQFDLFTKTPEYKAFIEKLALDNGFEPVEQQFVKTVSEIHEYLNAQLKTEPFQTEFKNYGLDPSRADYGWQIVKAYLNANPPHPDIDPKKATFLKSSLQDPDIARNMILDTSYPGTKIYIYKNSETGIWNDVKKLGGIDDYTICVDEKGDGDLDRQYANIFPDSEVPGIDTFYTYNKEADGNSYFGLYRNGYDFYPGVEWSDTRIVNYFWDKQNANGHMVKMPVFDPDGRMVAGEYIWGDIREEGWVKWSKGFSSYISFNLNSPESQDFDPNPEASTQYIHHSKRFLSSLDLDNKDNTYQEKDYFVAYSPVRRQGFAEINENTNKITSPYI